MNLNMNCYMYFKNIFPVLFSLFYHSIVIILVSIA